MFILTEQVCDNNNTLFCVYIQRKYLFLSKDISPVKLRLIVIHLLLSRNKLWIEQEHLVIELSNYNINQIMR